MHLPEPGSPALRIALKDSDSFMRHVLYIVGMALVLIPGLLLYIFEIQWMTRWWGTTGTLIGIFVPPVVIAFPFLYLVKVGFSLWYFGLWAVGIAGIGIAGLAFRSRE